MARFRWRVPAVEHVEHYAAQDLAVARRQLTGEKSDGVSARLVAREQELCELGGERSWRLAIRPVRGIGFVAAVGRVRDRAARCDEQPLELDPLRGSVDP